MSSDERSPSVASLPAVGAVIETLVHVAPRLWWAGAVLLGALAHLAGPPAERGLIALALGACVAGAVRPHIARLGARAATLCLFAATLALAAHLLGDDFGYRYVWLYSAPELPAYLKVANVWGGDEGTLLFLALIAGALAVRLALLPGWSGPGALVLCALFALGALIWNPFALTPADDLARVPSQGMNVHLMRIWMAVHPPLVFGAYMLFLVPAGGALQALATGGGAWPRTHAAWLRTGWLVLSAGLVAGMWWAYEDFTFGQFWHWDPVQTSVFMVWALATAQLHGVTRYRPDGRFALLQPTIALLTGIAALVSMAVTRSPALASSHRYVGDTSLPLLLTMAGLLTLATLVAFVFGLRRPRAHTLPRREPTVLLLIAITGTSLAAGVAAWQLLDAYLGAWLGWPRPDHLKPFFETLARWTDPAELAALREAFAQWDVDRYAMNRWLAPVLIVLTLAGGHYFVPQVSRVWRIALTAAVLGLAVFTAVVVRPLEGLFAGTGITSSSTTAIFPWLDALGVTTLYLILAAGAFALLSSRRAPGGWRAFWSYGLPIGLIHLGVMLALIGGTAATVLDSYAQTNVTYPADFDRPIRLPDGFTLTVSLDEQGAVDDGGRGGGFRTMARVGWQLERDGEVVEAEQGHAVYRDERAPAAGDKGAVRLMCEILDYRYARHVSGATEMMHPFIHRGLWRDVQVWVTPTPTESDEATPLVLKVYPLMSWLWIGLGLTLLGAAWRLLVTRGRG